MFLHKSAALLILTFSTSQVFAEGTRLWEQSRFDDFIKGTTHGVAISSDGFLELAPDFKLIASTPSSAVWATALGPQGEIYAATGAPARVYQIQNGLPTAIFQPQELQVQALVADREGRLYAATNPDGKVYSWWDYRGVAFFKNQGLRIDHILATPSVAERVTACTIDRNARKGQDASDHAPVVAVIGP